MMKLDYLEIMELAYKLLRKASYAVVLGVLLVVVFTSQGIMNIACWVHSRCVYLCYLTYPKATEHSLEELLSRAKEVISDYARVK